MSGGFSEQWLQEHNARIARQRGAALEIPANDVHPAGDGSNYSGGAQARRPKGRRGASGQKPLHPSRDAPLENPLQITVAAFLDRALPPPLKWLHVPNGELRDPAAAGKLKAMGTKPGAADCLILGWRGSGFIWIELKSRSGRLSADQKAWRDWCRAIGAPWFLCRSLEDVVESLESLQIRLKVNLT